MRMFFFGLLLLSVLAGAHCWAAEATMPEDYSCTFCHSKDGELWNENTPVVEAKDLLGDVHGQKGLLCHDCHGGSPTMDEFENHREDETFRTVLRPADEPAFCGRCHADASYMHRFNSAAPVDLVDRFFASVHGQALKKATGGSTDAATSDGPDAVSDEDDGEDGDASETADPDKDPAAEPPPEIARQLVRCSSCHPPHKTLAAQDPQSSVNAAQLSNTCGACHPQQRELILADVHGAAGPKNAQGRPSPLGCLECHGDDAHGMVSVSDLQSPVSAKNQATNCGRCHEAAQLSYLDSVHGHGLRKSGLLVTAVCSSCHGAHGILPARDARSTLHPAKVADTCGNCHRFIEDRLKASVHGSGAGPGSPSEKTAPGGDVHRRPSCTDCHQGHDVVRPESSGFQATMTDRCGTCHAELLDQYSLSVHGQLTNLGYGPAAKCADCHGAHEIQPLDDPRSLLSSVNRAETCGKCHPGATPNFLEFDPHADHRNPARSPVLYAVYMVLMTFLIGTFAVFGLHSLLWLVRGTIDVWRHGRPSRPAPGDVAFVRFRPFHRIAHALLFTSFLGLALTGLPLKYSHIPWAKWVAEALGGFAVMSTWHRIFGLTNILCLVVYLIRLGRRLFAAAAQPKTFRGIVFGPESPVPTWRDFQDFLRMIRWFFGLGPRPTFERWAYWEKFDFWGAAADIVIIGATGMILWFPIWFCRFLPGEAVNISKVIHSTQALLATGFVFAIHFYSVFVRPDKFPMDMAMLTGLVTEEELKHERPEYYERLRREGQLEARRTIVPSRRATLLVTIGGYLAFAIGTALLVGIVVAALTSR